MPVSKVSSHLLDKHIVITCNVIAVYVLQEKVFYLLEYIRLHQLEFFRSAIAKKKKKKKKIQETIIICLQGGQKKGSDH